MKIGRNLLLGTCAPGCGNGPLINPYNGPIQTNPHIYLIFWGSNWSSNETAKAVKGQLELYYEGLTANPKWGAGAQWPEWSGILRQYCGPNGCPVTNGASISGIWIDPAHTAPSNVSDESISAEINHALEPGSSWHGAESDTNAQFVVIPAPHATYQHSFAYEYNPETGQEEVAFCGFHGTYNSATYTFLANVADEAASNPFNPTICEYPGDQNPVQAVTGVASHEYAESVTDPGIDGWKGINYENFEEIGDLCNTGHDQYHTAGVWVQGEWDDHLGGCRLYDPNPPVVSPTDPPDGASGITATTATLNANVDPNGTETHAFFEYGLTQSYGTTVPSLPGIYVGAGSSSVLVSHALSGLQPNKTYHFRSVVYNSWSGYLHGTDQTFTTLPAPPTVNVLSASHVGETSATLRGTVNPNNLATTYRFEYGPTTSYGTSVPVPDGSVGSGYGNTSETATLHGLKAGTTYHYRIAATNSQGTSVSPDQVLPTVPWVAAGSSPVSISDSSGSNEWVYFVGKDSAVWEWAWEGSSWALHRLGGQVKPSTGLAPDYIPSSGRKTVYYVDASGAIAYWAWAPESGWSNGVLGGHSAASTATPSVLADFDTDSTEVFYPDSSGAIWEWKWTASAGWVNESRGGQVSPGSNLSNDWIESSDRKTVYYVDARTGAISYWAWAPGGSWTNGSVGGNSMQNSSPNAIYSPAPDTTDIYYFNPSGEIWHWKWTEANGWEDGTVNDGVFSPPPMVSAEAASEVKASTVVLHGTVNPQGIDAHYYFEYDTREYKEGEAAHGTSVPVPAEDLGSGIAPVGVSKALSGLQSNTAYHYRLVATGEAGTTTGADQTFKTEAAGVSGQLSAMKVTDPFNASTSVVSNFGSGWSALGWASGAVPKGEDRTTGWGPSDAYSTVNGAYYNPNSPTINDVGTGIADVATMATNPGSTSRYFSLWLDMNTPGSSTRAGYELRFTDTATNTYTVTLSKWVSGTQTVLATKEGYSFVNGNSFALADQGSTVSAWTNTGSGFGQLLSASDSTFFSGKSGVEGSGNTTRLTNFKVGWLLDSVANTNAALKALRLTDAFATSESPLSEGGVWVASAWDNSSSGHNTGQDTTSGWGPYDAFPAINGAFWMKAFADTGSGDAATAILSASPGSEGRYFSLWLNASNPPVNRNGLELRFTETASNVYEVALLKWTGGTKTVLASKTGYSFTVGSKLALVDKAGTVSAWTNTGTEYTQILSGSDSVYTGGYPGVEGSGNIGRLKEFRSGPMPPF